MYLGEITHQEKSLNFTVNYLIIKEITKKKITCVKYAENLQIGDKK